MQKYSIRLLEEILTFSYKKEKIEEILLAEIEAKDISDVEVLYIWNKIERKNQ